MMDHNGVHFMAQMIRHQRAILTSAEKWIASPTFSKEQALAATGYFRKVLDAYERSLGVTEVTAVREG